MDTACLYERNMNAVWHPCSQMKDYELFKPLVIKRAYGSYLELEDGKKVIDAISSWWCKSLGHNHPTLKKALTEQLDKFEHVILANTTNAAITQLSQQLAELTPHLKKVLYASDGSCAVEMALKMSLHYRIIHGDDKRKNFLALKNGYHGETLGALSMSDVGLYRAPYESMLFTPHFIEPLYVSSTDDPQWDDASVYWHNIEASLEPFKKSVTAIILEPILQGAGGMKIYSQHFLKKLVRWAHQNNIHIIADEIMTGIGRSGKMFAYEHADIQPDFVCLSKGLTSGWLPMSALLTTNKIYEAFYDDYETGKAFLHSHTYSGNALAASVAVATLNVIKTERLCNRAKDLQKILMQHLQEVFQHTKKLKNLRGIGAVVAADLVETEQKRLGYRVYQEAVKLGALLRPLGNTLYWLPPLNSDEITLERLKNITLEAIHNTFNKK